MTPDGQTDRTDGFAPFAALLSEVPPRDALRLAITAATLRPEPDCLPPLIEAATLAPEQAAAARELAEKLVKTLRAKGANHGVEGLIHEYDLSSEEGVALMCLAEALLRIPDVETRDALIRDKISGHDWRAHLGHSPSLFVNAATWGLLITGKLTATAREQTLASALMSLIGKGGEPLIRASVDLAMRLLGEHFVTGRTIEEALTRGERREREGFRHSYDMLGEAALTDADALRYFAAYEHAIEAIGGAAGERGPIEGPGISIKLSALHPRYQRSQRGRALGELYPRLLALARQARANDIGLNIDAEEAERLEFSLDLLEKLAFEPELAGWGGLGFVVQAYGKRAPFVIDWLIDLARRSGRRLMLRLVKGAYWDGEIKRAQVLGLSDFPVFTRKIHTDVSFLACARKMLAAPDALFPQFATHNAATLAAVQAMAGEAPRGTYEFQCLHGMGEPLYEEVVGEGKLDRPCRIYAPVGPHETLLAYLVRRLLENGANSSFVNRIADEEVSIEALIADPVAAARALEPDGRPHDGVLAPEDIYRPERANSRGLDLTDEAALAGLAKAMAEDAGAFTSPQWGEVDRRSRAGEGAQPSPDNARPPRPALRADPGSSPGQALCLPGRGEGRAASRQIRNPADVGDVVGVVRDASAADVEAALAAAQAGAEAWASVSPADRAAILFRAADLVEARAPAFYAELVREAGKTLHAAVSEVREAADFLRYYAAGLQDWSNETHRPLGLVACISPWNFPLAIFTGQVAAALAAGNVVIGKPAEETPLIAVAAVALLREAGVPEGALQLLPGGGDVGAALVADSRTAGVLFTGSTEVARSIQKSLSGRLGPDGAPVPLVAETGGQNVMVVASSALPEQAIMDVLASAFDSAGQRCSALRVLALQEDVADHVLAMLKGAAEELRVGDPARLSTDIGPVITADARDRIAAYVEAARRRGAAVWSKPLPDACAAGTFASPAIIEIASLDELEGEVFGPVLHVLRFRRDRFDDLVADVEALGYGLTFGLHTRIDETVERLKAAAPAGNLYVNRNMIGAVVGTQPFGGHGLSGTGPKAGGPLYLRRLLSRRPPAPGLVGAAPPAAGAFADWVRKSGRPALAARCRAIAAKTPLGARLDLPGPVGERNSYELAPRGDVLCRARSEAALTLQIAAALATGNRALIDAPPPLERALARLDGALSGVVAIARLQPPAALAAALVEGDPALVLATLKAMAAREGPIAPVHVAPGPDGEDFMPLDMLVREITLSVNTAAAGGNASLMALED